MSTFIKAGFWEKLCKPCKGYKGWLNLDEFVQSFIPKPTYKVFTALLTQSGEGFLDQLDSSSPTQNVTKGVTYTIAGPNGDFSNVGAPNNNDGTFFIAINNEIPNAYNDTSLIFNTGAPVVTVLENTIGNIWFTYNNVGIYYVSSNNLFTENKTYLPSQNIDISLVSNAERFLFSGWVSENNVVLNNTSSDFVSTDDMGRGYLEIRVYN